jgi:transglutaminase-like putative cysteine protease
MTERFEVRRPAEGWITLILVVALGFILGWSLDDPAWVNGHGELTDLLATCGVLGALAGFAGPKLGWGRWTTHLIGASFAALVIPILAGQAAEPGASIGEAFHFTAAGSVNAYLDLAWRGLTLTSQEIHYSLVLGIVVWATMQFASYAVFGHRRPLSAIVVIGLVLVVNMSLTNRDQQQLSYMIAFAGVSLFLLIQMHAFDERATWIRRRIGDPSTISALYLRGGTIFIVGAMAASMLLTTRAASAPLAGAWSGVGNRLVDMGAEISRLLPLGGAVRPLGKLQFGSVARVSSKWFSDGRVAFTATVPAEFQEQRWRAATYDAYEGTGWVQTLKDVSSVPVDAGQPLFDDGSAESVDPDLTDKVTVTVDPADYGENLVLSPGSPVAVDLATNVKLFGTDGWFVKVEPRDGVGGPYRVDAATLRILTDKSKADEGITENKLRAAGEAYPPDLLAKYTDVPDGAIGPAASKLQADMVALSRGSDVYDLAVTMESYLRSSANFTYDIDISDVDCGTEGTVECFARVKQGYCLHYASTMALLLRNAIPDHPIPTRVVQGFLPGDWKNGSSTVRIRDAHAWVEVYFPGYGWFPFDPTGQVGRPSHLPEGAPVAQASQRPFPSFDPNGRDQEGPSQRPGSTTVAPSTSGGNGPFDRTLLILFTIVIAAGVIALAFAAWLRGPRGELSPDTAWKSMSRTASRFGFGPRPTQTVYEYASSLGDLVPTAERDIQTVATAKVETTYAGVRLGGARLDAIRDATRRLRISLLRLMFRRPRRRRR